MNKIHKPGCMANIQCSVFHADGICPGPYGKCTCDGINSNTSIPSMTQPKQQTVHSTEDKNKREETMEERLNTILWKNVDFDRIENPERPMMAALQVDLEDFIRSELSLRDAYWQSHEKETVKKVLEEMRGEMLINIVPSRYEDLPEHAIGGSVLKDAVSILDKHLNKEKV